MDNKTNNIMDQKVAVAWDYLSLQLEVYKELLVSYDKYCLSIRNAEHKTMSLIILVKSLNKLYLCVIAPFGSYLDRQDKGDIIITREDYEELPVKKSIDRVRLLKMVNLIVKWAQTDGPLATINKYTPADEAW